MSFITSSFDILHSGGSRVETAFSWLIILPMIADDKTAVAISGSTIKNFKLNKNEYFVRINKKCNRIMKFYAQVMNIDGTYKRIR